MNTKKFFIIFFILSLIGILLIFIFNYFFNIKHISNNSNYSSQKLNSDNSNFSNNNSNNFTDNIINNNDLNNSTNLSTSKIPVEEELSSFSTQIYTQNSERQNNISITCSSLNDTIVKSNETFSFCDIVGKATYDKGYQKADVFQDGEVVQALGGGNCQVSTTLYNAVLNTSNLEVVERHKHSNSVPYIESGKDAAVAYGSYDFKFVNKNVFDIKIKVENTQNEIIIKLFKI